MKTYDIMLKSGEQISLRLSARALSNFVREHGIEGAPPVLSVLNAVDSLDATIALLTAAMKYPGAVVNMAVPDGASLLDALADEGRGDLYVRGLIVQLAQDAGLLTDADAAELADAMVDNVSALTRQMVRALKLAGSEVQTEAAGAEENPT